jgi:hypothetical protein
MSAQVLSAKVDNGAASGDLTVLAGVAGKAIRVLNYVLVSPSTVAVIWKDGGTALTGAMTIPAQGLWPGYASFGAGQSAGHFDTSSGNNLVLNVGSAVQVSGYVNYILVGI